MADPSRPSAPGEDPTERLLRQALAAEAAAVDPGDAPRADGLTGDRAPRRWPAALAAAAAVTALVATSALLASPGSDPTPVAASSSASAPTAPTAPPGPPSAPPEADRTTAPTGVPTATAPADPSPAPPSTEGGSAPSPGETEVAPPQPAGSMIVWSLVEQTVPGGVELRLVPARVPADAADGGSPVQAAVDHLLSRPAPDPDLQNPWWWDGQDSGGASLGVAVTDSGTTLDLPAAAFDGPVGSPLAGGALATLVRTVVSNGGTAPVTLLVDGRVGAEVWGAYVLDEPLRPDSRSLAAGWILDPYQGQRVRAGTVTLSGTATAFEGTVAWEVLDADGSTVAEGFTEAGSNGEYGPWTVPVELGPGTYTAVLRAPDMADASEGGGWLWQADTTFTVVP